MSDLLGRRGVWDGEEGSGTDFDDACRRHGCRDTVGGGGAWVALADPIASSSEGGIRALPNKSSGLAMPEKSPSTVWD